MLAAFSQLTTVQYNSECFYYNFLKTLWQLTALSPKNIGCENTFSCPFKHIQQFFRVIRYRCVLVFRLDYAVSRFNICLI